MPSIRTRALAATTAAALVLTGTAAVAAATSATAAPTISISKQWKKCGFPVTPNTTAWAPGGSAVLSATKVPAGGELVITGKAPKGTPAGTVLTMTRYADVDAQCDVTAQKLNIKTKVNKNRSFELRADLSKVGTYGYTVGYLTKGDSPEAIEFQFQLTTTS